MNRNCLNGHGAMETALFHEVEVDYCPTCLGVWFDRDELEYAKNDADGQLNWIDFDIWRHKEKFEALQLSHRCPNCNIPLVQLGYDNSSIKIDFCKKCQGIWLDRGEFKQIMVYLKKKADYEILHHYTRNLVKKLWEVFHGPKQFREELEEFLMLLKLFNYKFVVQHPFLDTLIEDGEK